MSGGISLFRSSLINARSISLSSLSSDVLEVLEVSDILEAWEVLEVCGVFLLLSSTNSFLTSRAATPTSCPQTAATPGTTSSTTDTSRRLRRALKEDERRAMARTIVEHLKLCGWK